MGWIYKITNLTNNKCYIGQTFRDYHERWKEHLRDKDKEPYCNWALYRMLNSISPEQISWEVIEETDDLDDRERYWISYYDSFKNGYNMTNGGAQGTKYNYDEILQYWLTDGERNFRKTARYFNMSHSYLSDIIKSLGYECRSWSEINNTGHDSGKTPVLKIDSNTGKILSRYASITEAAQELRSDNIKSSIDSIQKCCVNRIHIHKGYCWQYESDLGKPINLNQQHPSIVLPDLQLKFNNASEAADWFIQNNKTRSKNRYGVSNSINYALKHSGYYFGIRIESQPRIIYSHYEIEDRKEN